MNFIPTIGTDNVSFREKWLKAKLGSLKNNLKLLDAGAGELKYKKFCSHLEYVSQDFGQYDGKGDSLGLQTNSWDNSKLDIVSDIVEIPVESNSFDIILCVEVIEHIPRPLDAFKEFSRILKPGGQLILTAPFCSLTHFAPYHFYSGFNRYFYEENLQLHGFEIIEIEANGNYFEFLAQELRRLKSIAYTYSKVRPNIFYLGAIGLLLFFLNKCSKRDKKSSELLNYGFQIHAIKIS
jgi:SAM-dependent methyltransferase